MTSWNLARIRSSRTILSIWRRGWRAASHSTHDALGKCKRSPSWQRLTTLVQPHQPRLLSPCGGWRRSNVYSSSALDCTSTVMFIAASSCPLPVYMFDFLFLGKLWSALTSHCTLEIALEKEVFQSFSWAKRDYEKTNSVRVKLSFC